MCWSHWDANAVTAVATVATALFTAWAAWAALKSAKISERALKDVERPWLFLDVIHLEQRDGFGRANDWFISLEWKNVGRMPAVIKECTIQFVDKKKASKVPDYSNSGSLGIVQTVAPNSTCTTTKVGPALELMEADAVYLAYGKLTYTELNGKEHHTGYAIEVPAYMRPGLISSKHANDNYNFFD